MNAKTIRQILQERIMVLDGAMGTMIQKYGLSEDDFRGEKFGGVRGQLKGNNDLLCLYHVRTCKRRFIESILLPELIL